MNFQTLITDFESPIGKLVPNYYQEEYDKEYQLISLITRLLTFAKLDREYQRIIQNFCKQTGCKIGKGTDGISYIRFPKSTKLPQLKIESIYTEEKLQKEVKKIKNSSMTPMMKTNSLQNMLEKKRFLTEERGGHCHDDAFEYCFYHPSSAIVTSLIYNTTGNDAIIHSYVELDGYVYDLSNNLKLKKEDYDRYFGVQELTRISYEQVVQFRNFIASNMVHLRNEPMSLKIFCLFPEEYQLYIQNKFVETQKCKKR